MKPVSIDHLTDDEIASVSKLLEKKRLTVVKNLDSSLTSLLADSETLSEALHNILENAVQYTPEDGSITLQKRHVDSTLLIEVMDTGIGIDTEDLPHIFDRLYRANKAHSSDNNNGAGLGLSIANRILELHQGKIEVDSTLGQGSVFRLVLPVGSGPQGMRT